MPAPSADQVHMVAALGGRLATGDNFARGRAAALAWPRVDRGVWTKLCADGWLGLLVATDLGGIGGDARDLVALCDGTGDRLAPEPWAAAAVAARLLARCGTSDADDLRAQMTGGAATALLAQPVEARLDDATHALVDAHWATHALIDDGGAAFALRVVPVASPHDLRRTVDDGAMLRLGPDVLEGRRLGAGPQALQAVREAQDLLRLAAAAELVAAARHALDRTALHLRTRQQFGVALGTFQAIQHGMATCHVDCSAARALCFEAARAAGSDVQARAAFMAKWRASTAAMSTLKACVQYHGAMGFCDETDIAPIFRRVHALSAAWGSPSRCLASLAALPS